MGGIWGQIIIIFILILVNAFFAASEIALVTLRSTRVKQLVENGSKSAKAIDRLLKDPSKLLATIQIGVTFAGFLASAAAAVTISSSLASVFKKIPFLADYAQGISVVIVTGLISYVTLVLGELAPKRIAMQKAEQLSLLVAMPIDILSKVTAPFIAVLTLSTNVVVKLLGGDIKAEEPKLSEEEVRLIVAEQGALNQEEKEMIEGVFEFGDTVAKESMVPRTEMNCLESSLTVKEALEKIRDSGFTRYPVYEKTVDNIIGIITAKDILNTYLKNQGEMKIEKIIREVYFIPESKNILHLLKELQVRRMHMAIVLDEYGGTAGLITIEDMLEEIVGEIDDEYDNENKALILVSDNHGVFDGKVSVEDVNEAMALELPTDDLYETIAGLVFHNLGKKPKAGDRLSLDGAVIKVKEMERNRIRKVEIVKHKGQDKDKTGHIQET